MCTKHVWRTGRPPEGSQGASGGKYDGFIEVKRYFWLSPGGGARRYEGRATTLATRRWAEAHFHLNHQNTDGFSRVS